MTGKPMKPSGKAMSPDQLLAEVFSNEEIVVSLIRQLSWTHIIALIPLKQPAKNKKPTRRRTKGGEKRPGKGDKS